MDCISLAKRAYSALESTDYTEYFDLISQDVILKFAVPRGTPIGGKFQGKPAVVDFFTATALELFEDIRLEGPLEFLGSGNRVVILGRESYTIKKTTIRAQNKAFAIVLDFKDGQIVRDHQIKEMTEFIDSWRSN